MKPVRFTRASRKHRIGRTSARHVIEHTAAIEDTNSPSDDLLLVWVGVDERNRELGIVAVDRPDCILVIHVMPTSYRKKKP